MVDEHGRLDEMTATPRVDRVLHHHAQRMVGRDLHEARRVATPLELLFDLTFVTSFGVAASQLSHALAAGQFVGGLIGFGIASFGVCWAWTNFSWFASAYDTDDWLFRVVTMVQMIGVLVLAIGMPQMFASIEHGEHLDGGVMVAGYVIMRVALVSQWLRAARQDPERRSGCLTYAVMVTAAQIGWVGMIIADLPLGTTLAIFCPLFLLELAAPIIAERMDGGTPWHAHHIAERHGLFAIIALGEGVVGTVAALNAVVGQEGWTIDTALVAIAGMGLTFGMWWVYYLVPSALILHAHRDRAFGWGYGQLLIVTAIVATGAGLHVAAYYISHATTISTLATVLTVAIPVGIFLLAVYALYAFLARRFEAFHSWLLLATAAVIGVAVVAAGLGDNMAVSLLILMAAPIITVIGYELIGHELQLRALAEQVGDESHL